MAFGVTLNGLSFPESNITFNFTDTLADYDSVIGMAVTQDKSVANAVKLAEDGQAIIGRILLVEDRTSQGEGIVATIETRGGMTLPYKTAPSIGDLVVGGGQGYVKTDDDQGLRVWDVDTANKKVTVLF